MSEERTFEAELLTLGFGVVSPDIAGGRRDVQAFAIRVASEGGDPRIQVMVHCPTREDESEIRALGDESDPIRVRVGGRRFLVGLAGDANGWQATMAQMHRPEEDPR